MPVNSPIPSIVLQHYYFRLGTRHCPCIAPATLFDEHRERNFRNCCKILHKKCYQNRFNLCLRGGHRSRLRLTSKQATRSTKVHLLIVSTARDRVVSRNVIVTLIQHSKCEQIFDSKSQCGYILVLHRQCRCFRSQVRGYVWSYNFCSFPKTALLAFRMRLLVNPVVQSCAIPVLVSASLHRTRNKTYRAISTA